MSARQAINVKATGTTYASPSGSLSAQNSGVVPAPKVTRKNDDHRRSLKRWFIGPMPDKIATNEVKKTKLDPRDRFLIALGKKHQQPQGPRNERIDSDSDSSSEASFEVEHDHRLFEYFISQGGREEDWDADAERSIRREIRKRWKESGWYNVWTGKKKDANRSDRKWVGKSFLVGDALGIGEITPSTSVTSKASPADRTAAQDLVNAAAEASGEGCVGLGIGIIPEDDAPLQSPSPQPVHSPDLEGLHTATSSGFTTTNPNTSTTGLLHTSTFAARPDTTQRPVSEIIFTPEQLNRADTAFTTGSDGHDPLAPSSNLRSALKTVSDRKGKRKSVNFGDGAPAPPQVVLARHGSGMKGTSAGAPVKSPVPEDDDDNLSDVGSVSAKSITLRDRMLVRVAYNPVGGLPHPYDEHESRRHPEAVEDDWAEYIVCWRGHHLELYEDHSFKWFSSGKQLAFVVPLHAPKSRISVYSSTDNTFCVTCPPTPLRRFNKHASIAEPSGKRSVFHRAREGTNIFIFNCKMKSRSVDWMWHIWRQLGGEVPKTLEVNCPEMNSRVRIDLPMETEVGKDPGPKLVSRQDMLELCEDSLSDIADWGKVIETELQRGRHLELCWRRGANVEWVWPDEDIDGALRDWAVLCPAAFRQLKNPSYLEIRIARHAPTKVTLTDGTRLSEPPSIEGYLYRIRPNTQTRSLLYLFTHDGNLFTTSTAHSYPPTPPAPLTKSPQSSDISAEEEYLADETRRGALQMCACEGYIDLRNISSIRRALGTMAPRDIPVDNSIGNISGVNDHTDFEILDDENETPSDAEDEGGDDVLNTHRDKARLKLKRSFEVVLRSGRVVRLEAHSCSIALEWIAKLRSLVSYWTRRHRVDAREEMELTHAITGRPRWGSPEIVPDAVADNPYLGEFWNWCVMERCRPIVRAGRLFQRRSPYKKYKHMYHVLTQGHLIQFHLTNSTSSYHKRSRTINLIDAYVYSGQMAVNSFPPGAEGDGGSGLVPKRYQDGLEAHDTDEDMTFIIWFRPHPTEIPSSKDGFRDEPRVKMPSLSGKHKLLICQARSKLERDSWIWALRTEIERVARSTASREQAMRDPTFPMEDPTGQAFRDVIRPLLCGTEEDCYLVVMAHFARSCSVHHPLFRYTEAENSRPGVAEIFASRAKMYKSGELVNNSTAFDPANNRLYCDVTRTVTPRYLPITSTKIRSLVILEFAVLNEQFYKVKKWEEMLQPDDLSALMFLPGARPAVNGLRYLGGAMTALKLPFVSHHSSSVEPSE